MSTFVYHRRGSDTSAIDITDEFEQLFSLSKLDKKKQKLERNEREWKKKIEEGRERVWERERRSRDRRREGSVSDMFTPLEETLTLHHAEICDGTLSFIYHDCFIYQFHCSNVTCSIILLLSESSFFGSFLFLYMIILFFPFFVISQVCHYLMTMIHHLHCVL